MAGMTHDTLRPPDPAGAITVRCPECGGKGGYLIEGNTRPAVSGPCPTCRGARTIDVCWASSRQDPIETRTVHLVRLDTDPEMPAECLCEHESIPRDQLGGVVGFALHVTCMERLSRFHTIAQQLVDRVDEFDGTGLGSTDET